MSRRFQENIIVLIIFGVFVAVIVASSGYGFRASMVPMPMAVLGATLALVQFGLQNLRPADELQVDMFEFITGRTAEEEPEAVRSAMGVDHAEEVRTKPPSALRQLASVGIVALLLAMFMLLGPIPATFLFSAGYLALARDHGVLRAVVQAAVLTALLTIVFGHILQVQLDRSMLLPPIGPWIGL